MLVKTKKSKDIEEVLKNLGWKDFEKAIQEIFEINGFKVKRNFRFKTKKRYEIDIIAVKDNFNFCVDCKRLGKGRYKKSELLKAVEKQEKRTKELKKFLKYNLIAKKLLGIKCINFYPLIITLFEEELIKESQTFVVPVWKLNSFLNEAEKYIAL